MKPDPLPECAACRPRAGTLMSILITEPDTLSTPRVTTREYVSRSSSSPSSSGDSEVERSRRELATLGIPRLIVYQRRAGPSQFPRYTAGLKGRDPLDRASGPAHHSESPRSVRMAEAAPNAPPDTAGAPAATAEE